MKEAESLPLSRMTSINKSSFWIYLVVCMLLFAVSGLASPASAGVGHVSVSASVALCVFVALFLTLASQAVKSKSLGKVLTVTTYLFEVISVVYFVATVFFIGRH